MSYQRFSKGGRVAKSQFLAKKVCKNSLIRPKNKNGFSGKKYLF